MICLRLALAVDEVAPAGVNIAPVGIQVRYRGCVVHMLLRVLSDRRQGLLLWRVVRSRRGTVLLAPCGVGHTGLQPS